MRLVVGGDCLDYNSVSGSPATDLIETKLLLNSVISDTSNGERFARMDLKDIFLYTLMEIPEYMKVLYKYFPDDIYSRYNLDSIVHSDKYLYIKIQKDMYKLKQATILAYTQVSMLLKKRDTRQFLGSFGLRKHNTG